MSSNCITITGTTSTTVAMPTVTTASGAGLVVYNGQVYDGMSGNYYNNYQISMAQFMIDAHINAIVQREMGIARKKHPEVDFKRINDMLNSTDDEMRQLGLSTIGEYTKYLKEIFYDIIYNHGGYLASIVEKYTFSNRINITEEVI